MKLELQNQQLSALTKEDINRVEKESQFAYHKSYSTLIKNNFIMYNNRTTSLLVDIYRNICANYFLHEKKNLTTFMVTTFALTEKNYKLGICRSPRTTRRILKVLEDEGVIGRIIKTSIPASSHGGQFIYFKVPINQPFIRPVNKAIYVETDNNEQLQPITEEDKQTDIDLENNIATDDTTINELQEIIQKQQQQIAELQVMIQKQNSKTDIQATTQQITVYQNGIDKINLYGHSKDEFMQLLQEFCGPRKDSHGKKVLPKTQRAIERLMNKLIKASDSGKNAYDILDIALSNRWTDVYPENAPIVNMDKYIASTVFVAKVQQATIQTLATYTGKQKALEMIEQKETQDYIKNNTINIFFSKYLSISESDYNRQPFLQVKKFVLELDVNSEIFNKTCIKQYKIDSCQFLKALTSYVIDTYISNATAPYMKNTLTKYKQNVNLALTLASKMHKSITVFSLYCALVKCASYKNNVLDQNEKPVVRTDLEIFFHLLKLR